MKKEIIISIVIVIVLILIVGGLFYWWQGRMAQKSKEIQKKEEVTEEKIIETFGDIVVKETSEGKVVENKKEGISMKVPEGWVVQLPTNAQEPVSFYSPDVTQGGEGEEFTCKITFSVSQEKKDIASLKEEIGFNISELFTVEFHKFEVIKIAEIEALKSILNTLETGYSIAVYIPTSDRLYNFIIYANPEDKDKCSQEFNKFLDTVLIE